MEQKTLAREQFEKDQAALLEQYEARKGNTVEGVVKSSINEEPEKILEYLNDNPDIVTRTANNEGKVMSYDDAEEIATGIYKQGDYVKSDRFDTVLGIFTESEISPEFLAKIFNYDPEIEDRLVINGIGSVPDTDKFDYFLLSLGYDRFKKSNVFCLHSVPKGANIDLYYNKLPEMTEKFSYPTYANRAYFGVSF